MPPDYPTPPDSAPSLSTKARAPARLRVAGALEKLEDARGGVASLCLLGLFGLYMKAELMGGHWGLVARMAGKREGEGLSGIECLGYYHDDLLLNFILVPAFGALLAMVMSRGVRTLVFTFAVTSAALLYFVQLRAFSEVGQYVSAQLLTESFSWALSNPEMVRDYLTPPSVIKLFLLLGLLLFLLTGDAVGNSPRRGLDPVRKLHRCLALPLASVPPVAGLLLLPLGYLQKPAEGVLHRSALEQAIAAFWETGEIDSFGSLSAAQIVEEFRRQTATPPPDPADFLAGAEKGADVLLFVMETAPAGILELARQGKDLPGVGKLYDRSFVGEAHFSTYPYTSDAVYSLLSGRYPQGRRRLLEAQEIRRREGMMSALDSGRYSRGVYAPSLYRAEVDDRMYRTFGAGTTYYAIDDPDEEAREEAARRAERLLAELESSGPPLEAETRGLAAERLVLDIQALERMKKEIVEAKTSGRNFCALFLPQIGHAPWLNLRGRTEIAQRGRDIVLLQDGWLSEIVDLLASRGWLENTVIVFTADHGIRTRAEDPALPHGKLSASMLRVPLLIHAPRSLQGAAHLPYPTSHIDIAPTVLTLLGELSAPTTMQGIPVWKRSAENRIFLLGSGYAGADGFVQDGFYFMHHLLTDAVFRNDRLDFDGENILPIEEGMADSVRKSLRQARGMQISLVRRMIADDRVSGGHPR